MVTPKNQIKVTVDSKTYPLGENCEQFDGSALALLALSHTSTEHRLYLAMLSADGNEREAKPFTTRRLMTLAEISSLSTARRGLEGLVSKLSIERQTRNNGNGVREARTTYRVYPPEQVISRRRKNEPRSAVGVRPHESFARAIAKVVQNSRLSRREAQVALCCAEGLTNAEIGQRLSVSEQTVKFHLRHVYLKFGVKRRAELISRLLT